MHPLFSRRSALLLYLAGWVVPAALLVHVLAAPGSIRPEEAAAAIAPACIILAFACLTPWYLCRAFPLRRANIVRLLVTHLVDGAVSAWVFVFLALVDASALQRWFPGLAARVASQWLAMFNISLLYFLLSAAVHCVLVLAAQSRESHEREIRALMEAREAELRALKAQLSPHFLFNSLHSIAALAGSDPPRAREMCVRLSDYLRGTLGLSATECVPLARELELVRNYLEIERLRFSNRLRFEERVEPGCEACQVPALLLQPLIENAVKHGIANLLEGGVVRLSARRNGAALAIELENAFDAEAPPPRRAGMGLALVRKRLAARYGDAAFLQTGVKDNRFFARVRLPV